MGGQVVSTVDKNVLKRIKENIKQIASTSKQLKIVPKSKYVDNRKSTSTKKEDELAIRCPHWGEEMTDEEICYFSARAQSGFLNHMGKHIFNPTFVCDFPGCKLTRRGKRFATPCKYTE